MSPFILAAFMLPYILKQQKNMAYGNASLQIQINIAECFAFQELDSDVNS